MVWWIIAWKFISFVTSCPFKYIVYNCLKACPKIVCSLGDVKVQAYQKNDICLLVEPNTCKVLMLSTFMWCLRMPNQNVIFTGIRDSTNFIVKCLFFIFTRPTTNCG